MHIVHILPELRQGGVESVVLSLNRETVQRGHRSTVISDGGPLTKQIETDGGRHIALNVCSKNPLTFFQRARKLQTTLSRLHPDLLHVHSRVPAWLTRFANRKTNIPWVTSVHGFNSISRYSEIMTRGDRVICVSNPVQAYILKNYAVDPAHVRVVHGGIDFSRFDPSTVDFQRLEELRTELGFSGRFIATAVGRITELKDYETFIRAIALARKSDPKICGLIVGHVRADKQEYHRRLLRLIEELELQEHVRITDQFCSMPELYALSDVLVSCSKKPESFGLTLVEALAMNTPVIASRHGGPLDIVAEGENGCFFTPQNAEELAGKICDIPDRTFAAGREDALRKFSVGKMADDTLAVYAELGTSCD